MYVFRWFISKGSQNPSIDGALIKSKALWFAKVLVLHTGALHILQVYFITLNILVIYDYIY